MTATHTILLRGLALGLVMLISCSCSIQMYGGSRQDKENVARLKEKAMRLNSPYFVTLSEVNGARVADTTFGIDVPPGRVRATVLLHSPPTSRNTLGYRTVHHTFTAKAGHVYTFDGEGGKLTVHEAPNRNVVQKLTGE